MDADGKPSSSKLTHPTSSKTRRGYKRNYKNQREKENVATFKLIGSNAGGLNLKRESLFHIINKFRPSVVNIQETKFAQYNTLKIPGYEVFECLRKDRAGGGIMTAVLNSLDPVIVNCDEINEILVIQLNVKGIAIRIINAYGPQEDEDSLIVLNFWLKVESEIIKARENGCAVLAEFDANAKVGRNVVKNDPNNRSNNGQIMLNMLNRQCMLLGNSSHKCKGTVTRERKLVTGAIEKSVIDYVFLCESMYDFLEEIIIDEARTDVLRHSFKKKNAKKVTSSDHNIIHCNFSLQIFKKSKIERRQIFNFKCAESRKTFLEETSIPGVLSSVFQTSEDIAETSNKFFKGLNKIIHKCFKKIRIRDGIRKVCGDKNIQKLLTIQSQLSSLKVSECSISENLVTACLDKVNMLVAKLEAAKNKNKVQNYINEMTYEDKLSQNGFWNLRRKLCPKGREQISAKKDSSGNIVTEPEALKNLYVETYKRRLDHREMKPEFKDLLHLKNELWTSRLTRIKNVKTPPWTLTKLENALHSLKTKKSRDPNDMINEVFKEGTIGTDMKIALLNLFNEIKSNQFIPDFMKLSNITSIYKNKGSRADLDNDRGIFILTVLRKILDKLIYLDIFESIDQHMTDSNIGARKGRNIRDHLFLIYGVINSVIKGGEKCIDIQVYDIEKCFDSLWLEECLNDLYNTVPEHHRNDKISLLYETNVSNHVAIKTPAGITSRINIPCIVQQGGTWGSLLCANLIDTFGKHCQEKLEFTYSYKNKTEILPLAFIDDLNGISECGSKSLALNVFLTTKIEMKKLKGGVKKCFKMHVGKKNSFCPTLKIHGSELAPTEEITYLGDIITSDGKNTQNIQNRFSKGLGQINQIFNILDSVPFGTYTIETALLLRNSLLVNCILTNSEVWYNLTKTELDMFEKLDKIFFMKLLNAPRSTPVTAFYLELGIIPLPIVIQMRRIMYLYNILKCSKSSMLYKFFITQWHYPSPGDWVEQVRADMNDFNLKCDFTVLASKSKNSLKNMLKVKAIGAAFETLMEKKTKYRKLQNISYVQLEIQSYLLDQRLTFEEKKQIFLLRTRMSMFGDNFKEGRISTVCPLCSLHADNQSNIMECPRIRNKVNIKVNIEEVYATVVNIQTAKVICQAMKVRKNLLEK